MRLHLGHHFYGAGNLGDDFMLGGFLAAMAALAPEVAFTLSTPFPLEPMRRRFPQVGWLGYTARERREAIAACDAWVGLGGSPFQCAQSRWFIEHLATEAAWCREAGKPMYFLGVGVQEDSETRTPELRAVCDQAAGIWTRDTASARRLKGIGDPAKIHAAADLAHVLFERQTPPQSGTAPGRVVVVLNFDHRVELTPGPVVEALAALPSVERVWLAQETRPLPGSEKALFDALPATERQRWTLLEADVPGAPLEAMLQRWPAPEWLVTSRFHAAIAGAWTGARVVVLVTNEKLRGVADELGLTAIPADADTASILAALRSAKPATRPTHLADLARRSVAAFVSAIQTTARRP